MTNAEIPIHLSVTTLILTCAALRVSLYYGIIGRNGHDTRQDEAIPMSNLARVHTRDASNGIAGTGHGSGRTDEHAVITAEANIFNRRAQLMLGCAMAARVFVFWKSIKMIHCTWDSVEVRQTEAQTIHPTWQ